MDSRQSIVIIGAGVMGAVYARAVTLGSLRFRARLVGVCDVDAEAAARLATRREPLPSRTSRRCWRP